jgi:thymidylate kinase
MSTTLEQTAPRPPGAGGTVEALHVLESAGVALAVLRGAPGGAAHDVDVLVSADDEPRVRSLLHQHGWLSPPAAGHGSHRFYVRYDEATGTWHELDLVTRLDFGPAQAHRTELAGPCLARRERHDDGPSRLHPQDGFWVRVLHLAFKGEEAAARLGPPPPGPPEGPAAQQVARLLVRSGAGPEAVLAACREGDTARVRRLLRELRAAWWRAEAPRAVARHAVSWVRRRTAPAPGLSLALLGLDGAGKTTVAARLLEDVPWPTVSLYMGVWRYTDLDHALRYVVGARLVLRLTRLTAAAMRARYHRALGRLVLLDRHVVDVVLPSPDLDWKGRVTAALVLRTAPDPDRLVFLDAPAEVVYARKGELTLDELTQRRSYYRSLAARFPQLVTVDATQALEQVLREVSSLIWSDLQRVAPAARR